MAVLSRFLIVVLGAAAVVGVPGVAAAEPPPVPAPQPPPPPNVKALAPVKLSEYAEMDNNWYAFTSTGLTCVLQKGNGYGCNGLIPGAPDGANLVSGSYGGVPAFANTAGPVFAAAGAAKPPPAGGPVSYPTGRCGNDGTATNRVESRHQPGLLINPAGSLNPEQDNPTQDRPHGPN